MALEKISAFFIINNKTDTAGYNSAMSVMNL